MQGVQLETPSRIWRRIQAVENEEMPSLPSLPVFEDSAASDSQSESQDDANDSGDFLPIHSTPAVSSVHGATRSTIRPPSSTSSTQRFANSIASRSTATKSALSVSRASSSHRQDQDSFDVSIIPSIPNVTREAAERDMEEEDVAERHRNFKSGAATSNAEEDELQDLSLSDALEPVSRSNSPRPTHAPSGKPTPKKNYDYSVSLRSEPKPSPFDKLKNVSFRRPAARTRTPSLSRTTPSPESSPSNSTPRSGNSVNLSRAGSASPHPASATNIPLQRSANASPAVGGAQRGRAHENSWAREQETTNDVDVTEYAPGVPQHEGISGLEHPDLPTDSEADLSLSQPNHTQQFQQYSDLNIDGSQTGESRAGQSETQSQSQDEREPTFSSEEGLTARNPQSNLHSPAPLSVAFSSPAPSITFTPTPAFQARPRPRARFSLPTAPETPLSVSAYIGEDEDEEDADDQQQNLRGADDPLTPVAHKRSFLLSVINSTARPRIKATPHPNRGVADASSVSQNLLTPAPGAKLFAGVTPRPRPRAGGRLSHPLAQGWVAEEASGSDEVLSQSPYDSAGERASFISTASSHDLTTHARANTSFDPVVGLGREGHGVGRFNATKLNTYLHGLNRRLQEENEVLVQRLRQLEEERGTGSDGGGGGSGLTARRVSGGRRVSAVSSLGDVSEGGEEKAVLEDMVEELKDKLQGVTAEKEQLERGLQEEKEERAKDKERWKEKMGEVEKGVSDIVKELERQVREAEGNAKAVESNMQRELRSLQAMLAAVEDERDMALQRAEKAEQVLESGKELGSELRHANDRLAQAMADLRGANMQIKQLEEDVILSNERLDALQHQLAEEKHAAKESAEDMQRMYTDADDAEGRFAELEEEHVQTVQQLHDAQARLAEAEAERAARERELAEANEKLHQAEADLEHAHGAIESLEKDVEELEGQAERAGELARQMEDALEAAETRMLEDETQTANLKAKIASLEWELEDARNRADPSKSIRFGEPDADVDALEAELQEAHKEIAKLKATTQQSPARKAIEKAKDAKIELLENEKEELLERIKSLKSAMNAATTPSRFANLSNMSGVSPMRRHVLSFKSPKTPGGPLRELSWLQSTEIEQSVAPLLAEISRLQDELDRANESIDEKIEKLEDAGLGVVELTKRLDDARNRIINLEDEIGRLSRRDERRLRRLQRVRCTKCHHKLDLRSLNRAAEGNDSSVDISMASFATDPPTPPTKTSDALRANLRAVNQELESMKKQWAEEKRQLLGEKAVLQDAANRLNLQVAEASSEAKKVKQDHRANEQAKYSLQTELDKTKRVVSELEQELKAERSRLRGLTSERGRIEREKDDILLQLQRTESDMDDVKRQLQDAKEENHQLEAELRANATSEQKARLLDVKVAQNAETIQQLREERSLLVADHKKLQRQFTEVSEHLNQLRDEYAASQTSHESRRHQLDMALHEVDDLRQALSAQASELEHHRAQAENNRSAAAAIAALEEDLRRVKKEAEAFGRDLKQLRAEKVKMEDEIGKARRREKQVEAKAKVLGEQLDKAKTACDKWQGHVCAIDEEQLSALKLRHNKECKGLIVQIRYLKAKFTRESALRCDLGYQKRYLLVLLAKFEKSEQRILAAIARVGFAAPPEPPRARQRSLKSVALSVIFASRVKRASDKWRAECSSRQAVTEALEEVRRRRVQPS
ncbi:hypothetical protein GLOTRDRAFT_115600 [Gloeophyllum trabeum ATCC 11539]|uniref:Pericentrin/AKAP-450 centrosomal targeting domain-containing protein n=1 Tax=Gloeophyllum trabeum (strain ATCC 11539 / FP-39264 / Madison 617) TaxID=670483 RepID=S7RT49_GLOTA|nr:uncharacterized protein GLOTRDRAFT_115600 [Gloeophyllum trabeum ATCC 11539]EPQ56284.1 hypothetical protein GLOTRDRAFT_115600 [Gloeophyllum trabeum ATCC 11539]